MTPIVLKWSYLSAIFIFRIETFTRPRRMCTVWGNFMLSFGIYNAKRKPHLKMGFLTLILILRASFSRFHLYREDTYSYQKRECTPNFTSSFMFGINDDFIIKTSNDITVNQTVLKNKCLHSCAQMRLFPWKESFPTSIHKRSFSSSIYRFTANLVSYCFVHLLFICFRGYVLPS